MSKTKAVRDWEQICASWGCAVTRERSVQLHHVKGRKYKHNKVLIGPWYILPLTHRLHDVGSNNQFNVTHWPKRFEIEFGTQQKLFLDMVATMLEYGQEIPVPAEVLEAIGEIDKPMRRGYK